MKKNANRFLTATFCDDIRQEMGNKISLMGCYQGELVVSIMPIALQKLCVFVSMITPNEKPFKSLTLRIVQDDDKELARLEIPEVGFADGMQIQDEIVTPKSISTAIVFSPFAIEKPTSLRLLATTEEGEIIGPRLLIKVVTAQEPIAKPVVKSKPKKSRTAK